MTYQEDRAAGNRLRDALMKFRSAQGLLLEVECKLRGRPAEEAEAFWSRSGERVEQHEQIAATEVVQAFAAFSATGQMAPPEDQRLVTEAERVLAEAGPLRLAETAYSWRFPGKAVWTWGADPACFPALVAAMQQAMARGEPLTVDEVAAVTGVRPPPLDGVE